MAHFICAVSTDSSNAPAAYALTEQLQDGGYAVRDLGRLGDSPVETLQDLLADEEQYAGHVTLVVTGGQPLADRFSKAGLSAVAVRLGGEAGSGETSVSEQTLVDTFASVYRHRTVEMPNESEEASTAVAALYAAMSDGAGADDASPRMAALAEQETTGVPTETVPADGPKPAVPELSGSSAPLSTAKIGGDEEDRTATLDETRTAPDGRHGRVDDRNAGPADLGAHRDLALALALTCWYGEYDGLPMTDQADETERAGRVRDKRRRQAEDRANR